MDHRVGREEIKEEVVLPHKQQVGKSTTDDAHRHAEPEYALHTLHLPRTVILPDKTDCSAIERHDNEIAVEFKFNAADEPATAPAP